MEVESKTEKINEPRKITLPINYYANRLYYIILYLA